jgi:hypothetical protein
MTLVRILAWIHTLLGGTGLALGTLACLMLLADPQGGAAMYYIGPIFFFLATFYFAPATLGGVGVLLGKAWGRWILLALSVVLLLAIPIGTAIGIFGLWVLLRKDGLPKFEPAPPRTPAQVVARSAETQRIIGVLLAMAGTGSAMVVALMIGFRTHDDIPPRELEAAFYPALAILAAVLVIVVVKRPFKGWGGPIRTVGPFERAGVRRRSQRGIEAWKAERAERIEALSRDPVLKPYADRVAAGQSWSDAQIAYDRDRAMLATCRHMRPIEQAMRERGLHLRYEGEEKVDAECCIDEPGLWSRFPKGKLFYAEMFRGGRAAEDDPEAYLFCEACRSRLGVIHPVLARNETAWFPGALDSSRT